MTAKGYSTAELVVDEIGRDLTSDQLGQLDGLISDAEDIADRETGRSWLVHSPTVGELHTVTNQLLYLYNKPVSGITSITRRVQSIGAAVTTLTAGTDYELIDAQHGIVLLSSYPWADVVINTTTTDYGTLLTVNYTTATPVPGGIRRAVTQLVALWMTRRLNVSRQGVRSYSVGGGDLSVTYTDQQNVPDDILRVFRGYRVTMFA